MTSPTTPPIDDTNELREKIASILGCCSVCGSDVAHACTGLLLADNPLAKLTALLAHITAKAETQARTFEIEQALIVATTPKMTIKYMRGALNRRLATLKAQAQKGEVKS